MLFLVHYNSLFLVMKTKLIIKYMVDTYYQLMYDGILLHKDSYAIQIT